MGVDQCPYMDWIDTRQARRCLWKTQGSSLAGEMARRLRLSTARASLPLASLLTRSTGIVAGAEQRVGC